jgi:hypothetical protein
MDFPTTPGAYQTTNATGGGFVSKFDPTGSSLVYSTLLNYAVASSISVDLSGNAYVAGAAAPGFHTTGGAFQPASRAQGAPADTAGNGFVAKVNPAGSALTYATFLGGSGTISTDGTFGGDAVSSISQDAAGDAYVSGYTASSDFPTTRGALQSVTQNKALTSTPYQYISIPATFFVAKLDPTGAGLIFSTYLSSSSYDFNENLGPLLALDPDGNAYIVGTTFGIDFPVSANAFQARNNSHPFGGLAATGNATLTELSPSGSLLYSTYLGGGGYAEIADGVVVRYGPDEGLAVALDTEGNVYLAGNASSTDFPTTDGAYETTKTSSEAVFLAKFNFSEASSNATITALASNGNPDVVGQKITFTAYVESASGTGVPAGTVNFAIDNGVAIPVTLDGTGHANYQTSALSAGTHVITATYAGETHYSTSNASLNETINPDLPSSLVSPTRYSTLTGPTAAFTWTAPQGATGYVLCLSSQNNNSCNLYSSPVLRTTSVNVTGLPVNGETIYATLYTQFAPQFLSTTATYTAEPAVAAIVTAPTGALTGSSAEFTWTPGSGVTGYVLCVGSKAGICNLYSSPVLRTTSTSVAGLPTNGETMYYTLYSQVLSQWLNTSGSVTAEPPVAAIVTAPAGALTGSSAEFTWTPGSGVTGYVLCVGSKAGACNLYSSPVLRTTSTSVAGLPTNGETIYYTLYSQVLNQWLNTSGSVTAEPPVAAVVTAPVGTLAGPSATFTWTPGSGVTGYALCVGIAPGDCNLYFSPVLRTTSVTVPNLPVNGRTLYYTLSSQVLTQWLHTSGSVTAQ